MATVEVLLSKSSEACQWMVQYLVSPEGREITRFVRFIRRSIRDLGHLFKSQVYYSAFLPPYNKPLQFSVETFSFCKYTGETLASAAYL